MSVILRLLDTDKERTWTVPDDAPLRTPSGQLARASTFADDDEAESFNGSVWRKVVIVPSQTMTMTIRVTRAASHLDNVERAVRQAVTDYLGTPSSECITVVRSDAARPVIEGATK